MDGFLFASYTLAVRISTRLVVEFLVYLPINAWLDAVDPLALVTQMHRAQIVTIKSVNFLLTQVCLSHLPSLTSSFLHSTTY
jgi:hypothetical protein